MERRDAAEMLDDPALPEQQVEEAYRSLAQTHRWLGNTRAVLKRLRARPVKSVLDLGCGRGALLEEIHRKLGMEVIGFDRRPAVNVPMRILKGDAVSDPLPRADVALAICLVHELSEDEIVRLVRNVHKSCGRMIILDPVRHWLPLWLFRIFVSPFLPHINVVDGLISIRRSYTPNELRKIVDTAVEGTDARVEQTVAPLYVRQIVDVRW